MKKMMKIMVAILFMNFAIGKANAQQAYGVQMKSIDAYRVEIGFAKTTNIVFPHAIVGVDRGSRDVLVQKAKGVENILQIKAAKEGFAETNVSVVTADGRLNSFVLCYSAEPTTLNFSLSGNVLQAGPLYFSSEKINEAELKTFAIASAAAKPKTIKRSNDNYGIELTLNGIFVNKEVFYFKLAIDNQSNINYGIEQLRFFIIDQKKSKRTSSQEIEIQPLYILNGLTEVDSKGNHSMVIAVPKFTIPDKKILKIQLMEKGGGRNLELEIKNRFIVDATKL